MLTCVRSPNAVSSIARRTTTANSSIFNASVRTAIRSQAAHTSTKVVFLMNATATKVEWVSRGFNHTFSRCMLTCSEWMDAFAYACDTIGRPMIDVNDQWQRYIPQWYLDKNAAVPTSSIPLSSATSSSSAAPAAPTKKSLPLSEGAIGGIAVAGACLIAVLLAGLFLLRRMRKKVDRKTKEAAELADTHHRDGFQARIDQLRYGENSQESLDTTAVAASSSPAPHDPHDPYSHDPYGHYKPPVQGSKSPETTYQAYKPNPQRCSLEPYRHATPFRTSTGSPRGSGQEDIHPAHRSPVYEHYATKSRYSTDEILPVQRSPVYDEHGNKVGYQ